MKRSRVALLAVASFLGLGSRANAAENAVVFAFEGCTPAMNAEVERIARIELHDASASTRVQLTCGDDDARIGVRNMQTGKQVERTVRLTDTAPRDRPRLLALALAELARSSRTELETSPPPVLPISEPVESQPPEKHERYVDAPASLWRGDLSLEGMVMPSFGSLLGGVSLAVARDFRDAPMFVTAGVGAWQGSTDRVGGSVTARQLGFDAGAGLRASRFDLALGVRIGWADLAGDASAASIQGARVEGIVAGPELAGSVGIVGPMRVWVRSGWLVRDLRGFVANDEDVVVGGFHASLGVGLRLGR